MAVQIDWGLLGRPVDIAGAFQQGQAQGRAISMQQARDHALSAYAANPTMDALAPLAAADPQAYAALSQNERQRLVADRQSRDYQRSAEARAMIPDVLAGVGLPGANASRSGTSASAGSAAAPGTAGDIVVEAPRPHKTIADVYALDPELAGHLATQIGTMHDDHRKQLGSQADTLAVAAFAARQAPYAKRRDIIDTYRRQLGDAGFSAGEIDDFDPTDEALNLAITHSLGIKGALSQQLDQQKFAWQQRDDQIDNARDDRRVAIQDRGQRDASARGWSADRRAERRYKRGDGVAGNLGNLASDDLINMLEQR